MGLFAKYQRGRWLAAIVALAVIISVVISWRLAPEPDADLPRPDRLAQPVEIPEPHDPDTVVVRAEVPPRVTDGEFVSAVVCQECHPKYHDTWHDTFHRTMTQVVSPDTVIGRFDNVSLKSRGRRYHFSREGEEFWVELVDPEWDRAIGDQDVAAAVDLPPPRVRRRVVMSTGSHHYQAYWVNGASGNELWRVPWVFHRRENRWIPSADVFISPPNQPPRQTRWNSNCIQCHVVQGEPGLDPDTGHFTSRVSDYGIACEACHGPGRRHVDRHRQAANEAERGLSDSQDPTIVNPLHLDHATASQICGQCHSYFSFSDSSFWKTGFAYRPGDDLHATRYVHSYEDDYVQSRQDLQQGYWRDGTMRIAGREFSAMDDSACYRLGQLSCLSCHSLHDYESTDDQLAPRMRGDDACLQCHETYRDRIGEHTHHSAGSVGARCYECHMPYTSFGLLKGVRSHRIDSPNAKMTAEYGRPNACNLCHLDKSLAWTAEHLSTWYGQETIQLSETERQTSSALLLLLRGDAVQRAVVAWNFGRQEARKTGDQWQVPFLSLLLLDPYSAVRYVALDSLRKYPGLERFQADFLGAPSERNDAMRQAVNTWRARLTNGMAWDSKAVLLKSDGAMQIEKVQQLLKQRDDRAIELPE